jgi:hypothetical protein
MGVIEGGTAVLFAIVIYGLFYGLTGAQVRKVVIADEEPVVRIFGFLGIAVVALMVWALVGGFVYWGILIWFRIWLQDPHPWRQVILSTTGWFPFGLLFKYGRFPVGGIRGAAILIIFPFVLLLAGGAVAIGLRIRDAFDRMTASRGSKSAHVGGSVKEST